MLSRVNHSRWRWPLRKPSSVWETERRRWWFIPASKRIDSGLSRGWRMMSSYLRAAGGMRRASLGSGYMCITHRWCSGKSSKSQDQLRPPRLRHVDEHAMHGSWAARQVVAASSIGRAQWPATSAGPCRASLTCRLQHAQSRLRAASRRQGAVAGPSIVTDECYGAFP